MNTIAERLERSLAKNRQEGVTVQRFLLASGALSSLLYLVTDVLGGLRYKGYSFTSQAVSELMARGAPSEPLVDPLFQLYNVFVVAFGAGILRDTGSNRALRVVGALLLVYGLLGFTGPLFFEMNQRGTASDGDLPHIVLTAVLILLLLLAIGAGASAFGRRFRAYSLVTLLAVIGFGALTAPFAAKIAAGEPTPGFGLIERACIYSFLLWIAVTSAMLLQRRTRP